MSRAVPPPAAPETGLATLWYRNPQLLTLTVLIVVVAGLSALAGLPRLEDPRLTPRGALIVTPLPAASAERVEALITEPIEDELRELNELVTVTSTSRPGVSVISIELDERLTDTEPIFAEVRDALADARTGLPAGTGAPVLDEKRNATAFTTIHALTWTGDPDAPPSAMLARLAGELERRLRNTTGTEYVRRFGEPSEEIRVTVRPARLAALGLTAADVQARIAAADAKVAAGRIRGTATDLTVEVAGELDSIARVAGIPLRAGEDGAAVVTVGDVADIARTVVDPPREISRAAGRPAILIGARMAADRRVDRWDAAVTETTDRFAAELPPSIILERVFGQADYTRARLSQLAGSLALGATIVVAVILLVMGWRAALLVGSALPLSVAGVLFGLMMLGVPIHQMSVTGLIIALGLLIDNAIVMVDEVRRRRARGDGPAEAIAGSIRLLAVPLLGSTLTTVLSFMPIILLRGNVGEFVGPIAVSVILAIIVSFALAMTVVPALAAHFDAAVTGRRRGWLDRGLQADWFTAAGRGVIRWSVRHPAAGVLLAAVVPAIGFLRAGSLENQFFPAADRNQFHVQVWLPGSTAIDATERLSHRLESVLRSLGDPGDVERIDWTIGGSAPAFYYNMIMDQDDAPHHAHALVRTRDKAAEERLVPMAQAALADAAPEAQIVVRRFGQGPPVDAPLEVRIVGPGLDELRTAGERVRRIMLEMDDVVHARATIRGGSPRVRLDARDHDVRRAGLDLVDLAAQIQAATDGGIGGSVLEATEEIPVTVRHPDAGRAAADQLASAPIMTRGPDGIGRVLPAAAFGGIQLVPEAGSITRRNGERANAIKGYLRAGALPPEVNAELLERLATANLELPPGYRIETGGDAEAQQEAIGQLLAYLPVLGVLIAATIVLAFRSFLLAAVLGVVAGLSFGLALAATWAAGYPLSFMAMIGSAGLIGVAINDSIVVLAAIRDDDRARSGDVEAIVNATMHCSRHVLATTFTTIGGFIPLLLVGGGFWPPLAVVIAGGVGGATIIALTFIPAAYRLLIVLRLLRPSDRASAKSNSIKHDTSRATAGVTRLA